MNNNFIADTILRFNTRKCIILLFYSFVAITYSDTNNIIIHFLNIFNVIQLFVFIILYMYCLIKHAYLLEFSKND